MWDFSDKGCDRQHKRYWQRFAEAGTSVALAGRSLTEDTGAAFREKTVSSRVFIRANAVGLGSVPTDINAKIYEDKARLQALKDRLPLGLQGTKDEIANAVLFLAYDEASYITAIYFMSTENGCCNSMYFCA